MSVFNPNQTGEIIIGDAVATETTTATFLASASDKEIKAVSADGSAVASGKKFKFLQKTAGDASKGLNFEFTGAIDPSKVISVDVSPYTAETSKTVVVSGFTGTVRANTTYSVQIRLLEDGGTLSPENFRIIPGYYVTGPTGSDTFADILNGIKEYIDKSQALEGSGNFDITVDTGAGTLTVNGKPQADVRGKIDGRPLVFEVQAKVQSNIADPSVQYFNDLSVATTVLANPGIGTAKEVSNYEWFIKGFKYESYREAGYPNNFDSPYYVDRSGQYNVISIRHYESIKNVQAEIQEKVLTIFVNDGGGIIQTNLVLADLRTAGVDNVPADLA